MGTRRDYAASLGLAIAGARGRLSREANTACDKAEAEGTVFTGAAPVKAKKSPKARQIQPTAKSAKAISDLRDDESDAFNLAERTHPIGSTWKSTSGQIVNETAVCAPCGYSLGWHRCEHPQAVVSPGVIEYVRLV